MNEIEQQTNYTNGFDTKIPTNGKIIRMHLGRGVGKVVFPYRAGLYIKPIVFIFLFQYLLDIEERKGDCLPKIISILARHFEMLIKFLFNQWIILHSDRIPHEILKKM